MYNAEDSLPEMAKMTELKINSEEPPVIERPENTSETYIWINRKGKVAKTINRSSWPLVNIDYDEKGNLIGIEVIGLQKLDFATLLKKLNIHAPQEWIQSARWISRPSADGRPSAPFPLP